MATMLECYIAGLAPSPSHLLSDIFLPLFSLSPGKVCHVLSFTSSIAAPHRRGGNRPTTLKSTGQIWYIVIIILDLD